MDGGMTTVRSDRSRRRAERGASLVEFAIIMPVLAALLLGTITGGITLSRQNSVENAVREGTRFGAVYPSPETNVSGYLNAVLTQTRDAATGDLDAGVSGQYICVSYTDDTGGTKNLKQNLGVTGSVGNGACFADGRPPTDERVQVVASRTSPINAILYSDDITLSSKSVTRYER